MSKQAALHAQVPARPADIRFELVKWGPPRGTQNLSDETLSENRACGVVGPLPGASQTAHRHHVVSGVKRTGPPRIRGVPRASPAANRAGPPTVSAYKRRHVFTPLPRIGVDHPASAAVRAHHRGSVIGRRNMSHARILSASAELASRGAEVPPTRTLSESARRSRFATLSKGGKRNGSDNIVEEWISCPSPT